MVYRMSVFQKHFHTAKTINISIEINVDVRVLQVAINIFKASAHSFKSFTSRLLNLSFSLSMHLLPWMNVMLDFNWTLPVQLRGIPNKWTLQKNIVHGRIQITNTAWPLDYKFTVITTWPQLAWYEMELNVHEIYIYTIWYVWTCAHTQDQHGVHAAVLWYNICIVLQTDQCKYFIIVFNNIHML